MSIIAPSPPMRAHLDPALGTGHGLAVVGEEVEPLLRVDDQLATGVALHSGPQLATIYTQSPGLP